ncbi:MAG: transketolase family protein [Deltaproteobacteria bacterium]|nr:transketolase family protein [Deltaproteobacteria bacterium]
MSLGPRSAHRRIVLVEFLSTRVEYGKTLAKLGETNQNIVVLDADLSGSTNTRLFANKFPDRFFNMGVSEQDMMSTAAGLAATGKIPFASTFAIFATGRAWEQVRQCIAYSLANVKIVSTHGGVTVGDDGGSHQAIEDIGLMRILPNMTVIVPADGVETRRVIETIVDTKTPVYVRTGRIATPVIYDDKYKFRIGHASILKEGRHVTIVAVGLMVHIAMGAADLLKKDGISATVINMSTIKPLDEDTLLESAKITGAVVTAEEHLISGGLGSAVCEVLADKYPCPVKRIGIQDRFGISGPPERLLSYFGLTSQAIAEAAKKAIKAKKDCSSTEQPRIRTMRA